MVVDSAPCHSCAYRTPAEGGDGSAPAVEADDAEPELVEEEEQQQHEEEEPQGEDCRSWFLRPAGHDRARAGPLTDYRGFAAAREKKQERKKNILAMGLLLQLATNR